MPRDSLLIYSGEESATAGDIAWTELPVNIKNLYVTFEQSATAGEVKLVQTDITTGALGRAVAPGQVVFDTSASQTLHAFTAGQYPRYLGVVTSGTAECEVKVIAHFEKP